MSRYACAPGRLLLLLILLLPFSGCVDGTQPGDSGGDFGFSAAVVVAPRFAPAPASATATVNRIRLTAVNAATDEVIGTQDVTVDPNATEWQLQLTIDLGDASSLNVVVEIELLDGETVQWSGRSAPMTVDASVASQPQVVDVYRGPLDNLSVADVEILDPPASLVEGGTVDLEAAVTMDEGATGSPAVFWSTPDPAIISVDETTGVVTALTPGLGRVVATAGEATDQVGIQILAKPSSIVVTPESASLTSLTQDVTFQAQVLDARGAEVPGQEVIWSSTDPVVVESAGDGVFLSMGNGTASAVATLSGDAEVSGEAAVTVQQEIVTVSVDPTTVAFSSLGETATLAPTARDALGEEVADAQFAWMSSDEGVVAVDANGQATSVSEGEATLTVTATREGTEGAASADVSATIDPVVAEVRVTPAEVDLTGVGLTAPFGAEAVDALGNVLAGSTFVWSSSNEAVATVSQTGLATSAGFGVAEIRAASGEVTGTATLTVLAPDLVITSFQVLPNGEPGTVIDSPDILFRIIVENQGSGDAGATELELRILDPETNLDLEEPEFLTQPALGPGESVLLEWRTPDPPPPDGGDLPSPVVFEAFTDEPLLVPESNEGNNVVRSGLFDVDLYDLPPGFDVAWIGGAVEVEHDWFEPENWSSGAVPTASDNVFVPADRSYPPVLTDDATVNDLWVEDGAVLEIEDGYILEATGDVDAGHSIVGDGELVMSGTGVLLSGSVEELVVTGTVALADYTEVLAGLVVTGPGALLDLGSNMLVVHGDFATYSGGVLAMMDPGSSLQTHGQVQFNGGSTEGLLTEGTFKVLGSSFSAAGVDPLGFVSSGYHAVVFDGAGVQGVTLANAGPAGQRFNQVTFGPSEPSHVKTQFYSDVHIAGSVEVVGDVSSNPGFVATIAGDILGAAEAVWSFSETVLTSSAPGIGVLGLHTELHVASAATLPNGFDLTGALVVDAGASLALPPSEPVSVDELQVFGDLLMPTPTMSMVVRGDALFNQNGPLPGGLAEGKLHVGGNLQVLGASPDGFPTGGSHTTVFDGASLPQVVTFATPGAGGQEFRNVEVGNTLGVAFLSDVFVAGDMSVAGKLAVAVETTTDVGGTLTLESGSSLDVDGTLTAGSCIDDGATITGEGAHPCASAPKTWVGGDSFAPDDWHTAANWNPAGVPTGADDILIPSAPVDQPALSAHGTARDVTVEPGATVSLDGWTLTSTGSVDAGTTIQAGTLVMSGVGVTLSGTVPTLEISGGDVALSGPTTVNGVAKIHGASRLTLAGQTMDVAGDVQVWVGQPNSGLVMTNPSDDLTVHGTLLYHSDGPESGVGLLTAGTIHTHYGVIQQHHDPSHSEETFVSTGTHVVYETGEGMQNTSLATPGSTGSRFYDLTVTATGGIAFTSYAYIANDFTVNGSASIGGSQVVSVGGTFTLGPGALLSVEGTLNAAACDDQGGTIVGNGSHPCESLSPYSKVWIGGWGESQHDWSAPENWSPAGVPSSTDDVLIRSVSTYQPWLTAAAEVRKLTVESGAALTQNGFTLSVYGDVAAIGAIEGGLTVVLGSGSAFQGNFHDLTFSANRTLTGTTEVAGNLIVNNVDLYVGASTAHVAGDLTVTGSSANLGMQTAGGVLDVDSNTTFYGADEYLWLTAGTLKVGGDFTVTGTYDDRSFYASGTHTTILDGTSAQTVSFANPATTLERFQNLTIENAVGVTLASDLVVMGDFAVPNSVSPSITGTGTETVNMFGKAVVDGATFDASLVRLDSDVAPGTHIFQGVTFQNAHYAAVQFYVALNGGAQAFGGLTFSTEPDGGAWVQAVSRDGGLVELYLYVSSPGDGSANELEGANTSILWEYDVNPPD